ncbi:MAG: hypothetical protein WAS07_01375 [Micropruina sp.]
MTSEQLSPKFNSAGRVTKFMTRVFLVLGFLLGPVLLANLISVLAPIGSVELALLYVLCGGVTVYFWRRLSRVEGAEKSHEVVG